MIGLPICAFKDPLCCVYNELKYKALFSHQEGEPYSRPDV